jgi:hypothetical protein
MITIPKIKTFIVALFWHIYAGSPKATKQQILERFEICKSCEFLDIINSQCLQCGCNINNRQIFMNKLAWSDQKCPIDKWSKIN